MVIPPHDGAAIEGAWDGPLMRKRARSPADYGYYSQLFAWLDDGRDETVKSSYRFIHHYVSPDGEPGAPSIEACRTGIAVLNGARNGTVLRGADREGVYRHLARHLEEAGIEPPELRSDEQASLLRRSVGGRVLEVRSGSPVSVISHGPAPTLVGYAAVFESPSVDFGGWREIIARGAFDRALEDLAQRPVKALWNHDASFVLGSTDSGTLRLDVDQRGLMATIHPPTNTLCDAFVESVQRGDVTQMSFGFVVREQDWETVGGEPVRVLRDVELWEVSPVAFPAYPATSVSVVSARAENSARLDVLRARLRLMEVL